jgi:tetratricopeptide (TPR) repeat protein
MRKLLVFALTALAANAKIVAGQNDSVPFYGNLGSYSRKVTTRSPLAQQYFDQGLRLTYGFGHPEGVRAFRAAVKHDSACAMCWWGVAWARGPYINARMDSAGGVEAFNAIQRAVALQSSATAAEKALIGAMATRYVAVPTRANRPGLDSAYANAMREVARKFPKDLDAGALFGESLMVLRPWDQWTRAGDPKPGTEEVIATLEKVLKRDIRHPGACHSYIHAVEASRQPERAEKCGEFLGSSIPGASHIPHMPSHIWLRIGRYADGVIANTKAWHIDQQAAFGGPPGIYPTHNLHMLLTAAAFDGQSAVASQAARDLSRFGANAFYPMAIAARFGRWQEILESTWQPSQGYHRGVKAFALGLAHLANERADSARTYLMRVDSIIAATPDSLQFRSHPQKSLLGMARAHLAGELLASEKKYDEAIRALEAAVPLEDSLTYDEPEPWPIPTRHILGAILFEAGRFSDAERVYQEDLIDHPRNGWALHGLEQSLRAQKKNSEADAVKKRLIDAWARADTWLLSSRFAPRKPGPANLLHVH